MYLNVCMRYLFFLLLFPCMIISCQKDLEEDDPLVKENQAHKPTPYEIKYPLHFYSSIPIPIEPAENPTTVEGVALGRELFFEELLSADNSMSCASCHKPQHAFNDKGAALSLGINGDQGVRNAMPLFNLDFANRFNWHGSAKSIEEQAFGPVTNPVELVNTWDQVVRDLQADPEYPSLFKKAFGTEVIDSVLVVKALAQFERTLISGNSRFDNYTLAKRGLPTNGPSSLTAAEKRGLDLFMTENKGDCFHCHGNPRNPAWTDYAFRNNGLDAVPDSGLASVNGKPSDYGKFKTPSIRNLVFTAPYMHDGRFATLGEVIDFYTDNVQMSSPNIDPVMLKVRDLTASEKEDLIAFLKTLTDSSFVTNPAFQDPD